MNLISRIIKEETDNFILTEVEQELQDLLSEEIMTTTALLPSFGSRQRSISEDDYRGEHTAPNRETGAPLHDVTLNDIYPDDIYGNDAVRLYGAGYPYDNNATHIIQNSRNKPNSRVQMFRAVPKLLSNQDKIIEYEKHKKFIMKYGKLPVGVTGYDNRTDYYNFISDELDKLYELPEDEKVTINDGDWVGITLNYAKYHGEAEFGKGRFQVLRKTVYVKQLFTEGNSLQEWGYDVNGGIN